MAITVVDDPYREGGNMSGAIGKGLGALLQTMADRKMKKYEEEESAKKTETVFKTLGFPDDLASAISNAPATHQSAILRQFLGSSALGNQQQQEQQESPQQQQLQQMLLQSLAPQQQEMQAPQGLQQGDVGSLLGQMSPDTQQELQQPQQQQQLQQMQQYQQQQQQQQQARKPMAKKEFLSLMGKQRKTLAYKLAKKKLKLAESKIKAEEAKYGKKVTGALTRGSMFKASNKIKRYLKQKPRSESIVYGLYQQLKDKGYTDIEAKVMLSSELTPEIKEYIKKATYIEGADVDPERKLKWRKKAQDLAIRLGFSKKRKKPSSRPKAASGFFTPKSGFGQGVFQ